MDRAKLETSPDYQAAWKRLIAALDGNRADSLAQARAATVEFAHMGDFDLVAKMLVSRLPYEHARKEPEPPESTGYISDAPVPELSEEAACERHGVSSE